MKYIDIYIDILVCFR